VISIFQEGGAAVWKQERHFRSERSGAGDTTTRGRQIVELDDREVLTGRVVCDDIETLWADEVTRGLGALTPGAMARVEDGLRAALNL
jgi:hypothetical protein